MHKDLPDSQLQIKMNDDVNKRQVTNLTEKGGSPKMSLKETILLRKMENERSHQTCLAPNNNAKINEKETSEDIRKKLLQNRRKLNLLLNQAPSVISKSGFSQLHSGDPQKSYDTLINRQKLLSGRAYSPDDDDSSSDEELRDPVPEAYPQLSDEESISSGSTSILPDFPKHRKNLNPAYPSRKTHPFDSDSYLQVQSNPARPKIYATERSPLPEAHRASRKYPLKSSKSDLTQSNLIRLPYVSRNGEERRSWMREGGETIAENALLVPNTRAGQSILSSKLDTLSCRVALSSSGYSSSGSGNGSFSSSTSNASFSTPSSQLATSSDKHRKENPKSGSETASRKSESALERVSSGIKSTDSPDVSTEEDVFPVASWLESAEYSGLRKSNAKTERTRTGDPQLQAATRRASSHEFQHRTAPEIGENSVCMVEKGASVNHKSRVRIKLLGSTKSKKDEAVRNSLAFAIQAQGDTDILPDLMESPAPKPSGERDNNRRSMVSSNVAAAPLSSSGEKRNSKSDFAAPRYSSSTLPSRKRSTRKKCDVIDETRESSNLAQDHSPANSMRSLRSAPQLRPKQLERRPSLRDRLKGAFSFQNLRNAISSDKLETDKAKSVSHSYLNEYGEDIAQKPNRRPQSVSSYGNLFKPASSSSIFATVRMRNKRVRERRAGVDRNSIACDPKPIPEYDFVKESIPDNADVTDDVGTPGNFRSIGRILKMNVREGTMLIEMVKPSSGPSGFYVAKSKDSGVVYVSSLNDSYPDKMFSGLLKPGDEIVEINDRNISDLTLDEIYDIIFENEKLVILTRPAVPVTT